MGFFSKIKENLTHDGIKLKLDAPESISVKDTGFKATVTIENTGDKPQTIKGVELSLVEDRSDATGQNNTDGQTTVNLQAISNNEGFVLNVGETKSLEFNVSMSFASALAGAMPAGNPLAGALGVLGNVLATAQNMSGAKFSHYINAVAVVDGLTLQPSVQRNIQLLNLGETSLHIGL